jgi:hypothetical protein
MDNNPAIVALDYSRQLGKVWGPDQVNTVSMEIQYMNLDLSFIFVCNDVDYGSYLGLT